MAVYMERERRAVLTVALQAVGARGDGSNTEAVIGTGGSKQNFDLDKGGMCCRFVRQVFEVALRLVPHSWPYRGDTAKATLSKLRAYRVPIAKRQPGDVLGCPGDPGHIAIYVGDAYGDGRELVAENTISTRRGYPKAAGTKVSSWDDFAGQHSSVTCYRLFPEAKGGAK